MSTPSPEQLRLAADIIEQGLPFEQRNADSVTGRWNPPFTEASNAAWHVLNGFEIRAKPWTLPEPPKGRQWNNSGFWTAAHLPSGFRPLLSDEKVVKGDEYFSRCDNSWEQSRNWNDETCGGKQGSAAYRTTRPLPAEPEWIPLGPEDVLPGSSFKHHNFGPGVWRVALTQNSEGVRFVTCDDEIEKVSWDDLARSWQISRDNGKTWEPAKKLKVS